GGPRAGPRSYAGEWERRPARPLGNTVGGRAGLLLSPFTGRGLGEGPAPRLPGGFRPALRQQPVAKGRERGPAGLLFRIDEIIGLLARDRPLEGHDEGAGA